MGPRLKVVVASRRHWHFGIDILEFAFAFALDADTQFWIATCIDTTHGANLYVCSYHAGTRLEILEATWLTKAWRSRAAATWEDP